jgi:porin
MASVVVSRNVFSHFVVDAALQGGQLAHTGNWSITAAYNAPIVPGVSVGIGLGYTDHPTPVIYTPQTGSALNLLANVVMYW